jgi:hypothetical protein
VFAPGVIDAERHHDAVRTDVDPVDSSATRSRASRAVDRQVASYAAHFATNRRLTALLLVPREAMVDGSGSRLRAY